MFTEETGVSESIVIVGVRILGAVTRNGSCQNEMSGVLAYISVEVYAAVCSKSVSVLVVTLHLRPLRSNDRAGVEPR